MFSLMNNFSRYNSVLPENMAGKKNRALRLFHHEQLQYVFLNHSCMEMKHWNCMVSLMNNFNKLFQLSSSWKHGKTNRALCLFHHEQLYYVFLNHVCVEMKHKHLDIGYIFLHEKPQYLISTQLSFSSWTVIVCLFKSHWHEQFQCHFKSCLHTNVALQ